MRVCSMVKMIDGSLCYGVISSSGDPYIFWFYKQKFKRKYFFNLKGIPENKQNETLESFIKALVPYKKYARKVRLEDIDNTIERIKLFLNKNSLKVKEIQQRNNNEKKFLLLFDDPKRGGYRIYTNEIEVDKAYKEAKNMGINCQLFESKGRNERL